MMTTRKRIARPEIRLQKDCAKFMRAAPVAGLFWTAINPIPGSNAHLGKIAKDMGLLAGVPDWLLIWEVTPFFIEFKATKGHPDKNQRQLHAVLAEQMVKVWIVRSLDELKAALKAHGVPT